MLPLTFSEYSRTNKRMSALHSNKKRNLPLSSPNSKVAAVTATKLAVVPTFKKIDDDYRD